MAGYLNQNGNSIGSLLRFIQEQKSQSPIIPQGAEVGSPLRNVVQEPLKGSEGIGTSKVVSLRPEGTLTEGGEAIKQGTPQSSRVGPISIGGEDVGPVAPPSVVAANEPGTGFSIPSATRTAGDVVNKTAAASGEPKITTPSLGAPSIKPLVPESQKGTPVIDYSLRKSIEKQDITDQATREAIARGERSTAETLARGDELTKEYERVGQSLDDDISSVQRARAVIAYAENPTPENYIAYQRAITPPKPTPTPMPMQGEVASPSANLGGQVQGASTGSSGSGGSSGGGGGTTSGVIRSVAPKINYATQQSKNQYSTPVPRQSTPASTPIKSTPAPKAPSIGTVLGGGALQAIKKLFRW